MSDSTRRLACCLLLLALAGTVSGAGFPAAAAQGTGTTGSLMAADPFGRDGTAGSIAVSGLSGADGCHFPLLNLPAYYVCVMICKLEGGGDTCPGYCERALSVCPLPVPVPPVPCGDLCETPLP